MKKEEEGDDNMCMPGEQADDNKVWHGGSGRFSNMDAPPPPSPKQHALLLL